MRCAVSHEDDMGMDISALSHVFERKRERVEDQITSIVCASNANQYLHTVLPHIHIRTANHLDTEGKK